MKTKVKAKSLHGTPFMPEILKRIAPKLKARVLLEPEFGIVGLIRFRNGCKSYFWHNKFNLNSVSSARIAQDKGYTLFFLKKLGYSVPHTQTFFEKRFIKYFDSERGAQAAYDFAKDIGWPVIVKPCRRSQGAAVALADSKKGFFLAAKRVFEIDRTMLVQEYCSGRDYRIVVLDEKVISAYERIPLHVTGDGRSSISDLLVKVQDAFCIEGRDTVLDTKDPRIADMLRRQHLRIGSIIRAGKKVTLMPAANLSCGGTTVEITNRLHTSVAKLAVAVAGAMDLRFVGIDLLMGDATRKLGQYKILEVNSAPGLDHYGSHGSRHQAHIDALYLKVLKAIQRGPKKVLV